MNLGHAASTSSRYVESTVNYSVDAAERPVIINADHTKNIMSLESRKIAIADASVAGFRPSLEQEGFYRADHPVDLDDITTSLEAADRYRASLVPLLLGATGADEIIMNPAAVVRRQKKSAASLTDPVPVTDPVNFVHTDYSLAGAAQGELHFSGTSRSNVKRKAMLNMWRLLSPGPTNLPLALCDSGSVRPDDIIPGDSVFPDGSVFETAFVRYNQDHRWYYYPDLRPDQVLIFKQSDTDGKFPRLVPHTAFVDDTRPPAASRVSIECRCMAVWYD